MRSRAARPGTVFLVWMIACLAPALSAASGSAVRIVPTCTIVDPGEEFDLPVIVSAEAGTISTFQVVFRFDPDVIECLGADEGSLYVNSGYTTWFVAEEESSGVWEVWDVIFPGGSYVVAPGELTVLRFRAVQDGYSDIVFLTAEICDIERYPLEDVETVGAYVCVGDAATGAGSGRPPSGERRLIGPYPNPTRGSTRLAFAPPAAGRDGACRFTVHDARGRMVASGAGPGGSVLWDGRNRRGGRAAPGIYFIRLVAPEGTFTRRVTLIR